MKCLVIAASHRPASLNRTLAAVVAPLLEAEGFSVTLPPYAEFDLPLFNDDERERGLIPGNCLKIAKNIEKTDAFVLVSPEYNWSYPASLKNLIDWLSHLSPCPLSGKPVLLMSASPSKRGGVLGITHLKVPLEALGMFPYPASFLLPEAHQAFTPERALASADQHTRLANTVSGFARFATSLRSL